MGAADRVLDRILRTARELDGGGPAVIVLHGPPGIGKFTRADLAADRLHREQGATVLELRPGRTPEGPANEYRELLRMLGARAVLPIETDADHLSENYARVSERVRTVLLLDDVTHWHQVRTLLPSGPDALVIATSRLPCTETLGVEPHQIVNIPVTGPGLAECAQVFRAAVGTARPLPSDEQVEAVVDACHRRPLAIRLAASLYAQRRHRGPEEFLRELAERGNEAVRNLSPARTRGPDNLPVDTVLRWAYDDLLRPGQQELLQVLSLPATSTVNAHTAAALLSRRRDDAPDSRTVEHVTGLLHELVRLHFLEAQRGDRFRIPSAVRRFAAARLSVSSDHEEMESREAAMCLLAAYHRLTLPAQPLLDGQDVLPPSPFSGPEVARLWLEEEKGAILRALQHAERSDPGITLDVVRALCSFCVTTGDSITLAMLVDVVDHAGRGAGDGGSGLLNRIRCVIGLAIGVIARRDGQLQESCRQLMDVRAMFIADGDVVGEAWALRHIGVTQHCMGDFVPAMRYLRRSRDLLAARERLGEPEAGNRLAWVLHSLGALYAEVGGFEEAATALTESLRLHRRHGSVRGRSWAQQVLASCRLKEPATDADTDADADTDTDTDTGDGNADDAERLLDAAAKGFRQTGDLAGLAAVRLVAARAQLARGERTEAERQLRDAIDALTGRPDGEEAAGPLNMQYFCADRRALAWTRFEYARCHDRPTETARRRAELAEAEALFKDIGDRYGTAWVAYERAVSDEPEPALRLAQLTEVREEFRQLGSERDVQMVQQALGQQEEAAHLPDPVTESQCFIDVNVVGHDPGPDAPREEAPHDPRPDVVKGHPCRLRLGVHLDRELETALRDLKDRGRLSLLTMSPRADARPHEQLLPPVGSQWPLTVDVALTPPHSGTQDVRFVLLAEHSGTVLQDIDYRIEVSEP
ncbi:tetratricopeptide repeat protein [Streptomyces beigongshangae]|uniref:tetratricopeptide repeat protein n=1 Tax=Streptomyces beigongshangae TaxID=2841597 RepID=UPI001C85848C|nr:tetratricopeptide repeat protein [Streptomyces sp. REN17]